MTPAGLADPYGRYLLIEVLTPEQGNTDVGRGNVIAVGSDVAGYTTGPIIPVGALVFYTAGKTIKVKPPPQTETQAATPPTEYAYVNFSDILGLVDVPHAAPAEG